MSPICIWRIEHKETGMGPFINGSTLPYAKQDLHAWHLQAWQMPTASCDNFNHHPPSKYRYGCQTFDLINEWFIKPDGELLATAGFELAVYFAMSPDVMFGDNQVAFNSQQKVWSEPLWQSPKSSSNSVRKTKATSLAK